MSYLDKLIGAEEHILLVTRRHWLGFVRDTLRPILAALLIVVICVAAMTWGGLGSRIILGWNGYYVVPMLTVVCLAFPVAVLTIAYAQWQASEFVVTNLRVMHVEGVFSKSVLDSSLEKVNDVLLHQSVMGRMLNFGDVEILTASEAAINKCPELSHPLLFKSTMLNAKRALEVRDSGQEEAANLPSVIANLAALRDQGLLTSEEFEQKKTDLLNRL